MCHREIPAVLLGKHQSGIREPRTIDPQNMVHQSSLAHVLDFLPISDTCDNLTVLQRHPYQDAWVVLPDPSPHLIPKVTVIVSVLVSRVLILS